MIDMIRAHLLSCSSLTLQILSITSEELSHVITALAALLTACGAFYFYYQQGRLKKAERLAKDKPPIEPEI